MHSTVYYHYIHHLHSYRKLFIAVKTYCLPFIVNNIHNVYGNLGNSHGTLYPVKVTNLNLTVNMKGNYKLVNDNGVSFKVNSDNLGNYVKYKNHKLYM